MKPIIRVGIDYSLGHCWPPAPAVQGSPNVFIGGIPVVRVGDLYPTHPGSCGAAGPHPMGIAATGSETVFINGKPLHRQGDLISCGDIANFGSKDVLAN